MNNQLIRKIINTNDTNDCAEFTYEHPLLDRNVASALARSFVKILRVSQQDSNINNNVRYSVLSNIRQLCRIEPDNHMQIDENFAKSLSDVYMDNLKSLQTEDTPTRVECILDDLLMRRMNEIDFNSNYQYSMKPEVVQALLNLTENSSCVELISRNVLHWNMSDKKNIALVKNLWADTSLSHTDTLCGNMSILMKSEIENSLLNSCHRLLTEPSLKAEHLFSVHIVSDLVKKCSLSSECFQICSRILNYLLIHTSYHANIQLFISKFVGNVKSYCSNGIANLYPAHLSNIVVLLDIDLNSLSETCKSKYVEQTLKYLKRLQDETDLILLLSHFSQWFPIYTNRND